MLRENENSIVLVEKSLYTHTHYIYYVNNAIEKDNVESYCLKQIFLFP